MSTTKTLIAYKMQNGEEPATDWLLALRDILCRRRIEARIERIKQGNYGDHKRFYGIIEIRLHFGKGYRLYCAEDGDIVVILLAAGDKATQAQDIKKALDYLKDYEDQKKI